MLIQSQEAASAGKNKQTLYISVWAPGAHILQQKGQGYHCGCVEDQYQSPYQTRAK